MLHRQQNLDKSRHSRCRFKVADICLYGSNQEWMITASLMTQHSGCGLYFKRVSQLSSRSMCFQQVDVGRLQASTLKRLTNYNLLRFGIGRR